MLCAGCLLNFLILSRRKRTIRWAHHWANINLKRIGLDIHPDKTRITTFTQGFQFVGWFFVNNDTYQLK